jgi:hypothetical protein
MLHQSSMDLMEMENGLFEIKIRHQITVAPMRDYIEYWLRKSLIKITKPEQQETIATIMPPQPLQVSTKEEPPRK